MTSEQYVKAYLSQDAYFTINKYFIKQLGLVETALLSLLLDRQTLFSQQGKTEDGWFYCTNQHFQDTLNLGRKTVDTALANIEQQHLIETQRKGLPAKKYFRVSFDAIKNIMEWDNQVCPKRTNLNIQNGQVIKNKDINYNTPISISTPYVVDTLISPKGEGRESYATTEVSNEELLFDDFRRAYRGTKRGLATEFANFKKKHSDWKQVVSILKSSYEHQCALKDEARQRGCFVAQEKNLQTYINQRCWEEEPQFSEPNKPHEKNFLEKMRRSDEIYRTLKNLENG